MKAVKVEMAGESRYLAFNGCAMFAFEDAFGGSGAYFEKSAGAGREAFEAVCAAAAILAEQGELARRAMGYDKEPILTPEQIMTCTTPAGLLRLRQAVLTAVLAGYGREVESEEPVDLTLLELEQKKRKN